MAVVLCVDGLKLRVQEVLNWELASLIDIAEGLVLKSREGWDLYLERELIAAWNGLSVQWRCLILILVKDNLLVIDLLPIVYFDIAVAARVMVEMEFSKATDTHSQAVSLVSLLKIQAYNTCYDVSRLKHQITIRIDKNLCSTIYRYVNPSVRERSWSVI